MPIFELKCNLTDNLIFELIMSLPTCLKIGTRASDLARKQTEIFCEFLRSQFPAQNGQEMEIIIVPISTDGDQILDKPLYDIGGKGLFIKQLDSALLDGQIDIAVHSAKDLESELAENTQLACVLEREDHRDCLIGRAEAFQHLQDLPQNAVVGTCSPRRQAQLLALRPDLNIVPIRGTVPTRLEKLHSEKLDAIMLANAGLQRLGLQQGVPIDANIMLPAAGQGSIVATIHADNKALHQLLYPLSHPLSLDRLNAERALLRQLGGSCRTPIGVNSVFQHRSMNDRKRNMPAGSELTAQLTSLDGREHIRLSLIAGKDGDFKNPEIMGDQLGLAIRKSSPHLLP